MRILVTGSSGMIGSALVPKLEDKCYDVIGLDKDEPKYTHPKKFFQWDLLNDWTEEAKKNLENIDLIIHLAANARVWQLTLDPKGALENATMVHNIFELARTLQIKKVIFASSREVYGNGADCLPISEEVGSQRDCESVYAASKVFGECYCHAYRRCYNIDAQIVRFSNVYGRFDHSDRLIPKVIELMIENKTVELYNGQKLLDFTFLDDAVSGVVALVNDWPNADQGHEWNIASGVAHRLNYVVHYLSCLLKSGSKIIEAPIRPGEVHEYQANIHKMNQRGWYPRFNLQEGLQKAVNYYKN